MCLCIVLKVYGGHKYLFSFNIKASNIEWVLNCDTYSPCSLGVPIYPLPLLLQSVLVCTSRHCNYMYICVYLLTEAYSEGCHAN